ncbi:hypothetical protein LguiA_021323 [Lonicera macranthoides]
MARSKVMAFVIVDKNAWNAKEMEWYKIHSDDKKSYRDLVQYVEVLQWTNLGTRCSLEVELETFMFCRIFVVIGGCINRFLRCRPILGVNTTFLKSKFRGTLMVATAVNREGGIINV